MNRSVICITFIFILVAWTDAQVPPPRFVEKKFKNVNGRKMAYVEVGTGDPIVFLHGNPTSSFLWRNIMPHLEGQGRLIAPDMIGMGDSEKLPATDPSRYIAVQHANYLFSLLEQLGVKEKVTLVIHDWGSFMGFLWAYRNRFNPNAIKGIVFMEAFVTPFSSATRPEIVEFFRPLRGPEGETIILENNFFIEVILPNAIFRNLTAAEMNEFRRPFLSPGEDRRPTLTFPRQVPIDGVPEDVTTLLNAYSGWIANTSIPKLLIAANPGSVLVGEALEFAKTWKNLELVTVKGIHFIQEDSPEDIGDAISKWISTLKL